MGLGLGIPLALAIMALGLWFCLRRRRRRQPAVTIQVAEPGMEVVGSSAILRKDVSTQGPSSQIQTREIIGASEERMDTFLVPVSPSLPVSTPTEHEVSGEGLSMELPGQSRSPPPNYSQASASQPRSGGQVYGEGHRWELG